VLKQLVDLAKRVNYKKQLHLSWELRDAVLSIQGKAITRGLLDSRDWFFQEDLITFLELLIEVQNITNERGVTPYIEGRTIRFEVKVEVDVSNI
jgi:hypothetical protein